MESKGLLDAIEDILSQLDNLKLVNKPLFNHVDIWNSQINHMQEDQYGNIDGYNVQFPAIFLEMKQKKESKTLGMGVSMIDYDVIFHIYDRQEHSRNKMDRNTKVFGLRNLVKQKFTKYTPNQMGTLFFVEDVQDNNHNNMYHFRITFRAALIDSWGNNFPISGTATPVLTIGYTASIDMRGVSFDSVSGTQSGTEGTLIVYYI